MWTRQARTLQATTCTDNPTDAEHMQLLHHTVAQALRRREVQIDHRVWTEWPSPACGFRAIYSLWCAVGDANALEQIMAPVLRSRFHDAINASARWPSPVVMARGRNSTEVEDACTSGRLFLTGLLTVPKLPRSPLEPDLSRELVRKTTLGPPSNKSASKAHLPSSSCSRMNFASKLQTAQVVNSR